MSRFSDLDHLEIKATVYRDRVEEVHQISDTRRGLRKVAVTKVWQTREVLGRGTFGQVCLQVQDQEPENLRALKTIPLMERMSKVECKRELTALIEFTKPKYKEQGLFVSFLGWFQTERDMHLAMEYIPLGDLETNLRELEKSKGYSGRHNNCVLPQEEVKNIVKQVLEGVSIMHREGFAHRDLKPQNLLVVQRLPQWWIKIGDFGLSKRASELSAYQTIAGTQKYMAPEMFHYVLDLDPVAVGDRYTDAIDLWALGCITSRILMGEPPFPDLLMLQKYCYNYQPATAASILGLPGVDDAADDFVQRLLVPHPGNRLTADSALKHAWVGESEDVEAPAHIQSSPPRISLAQKPDMDPSLEVPTQTKLQKLWGKLIPAKKESSLLGESSQSTLNYNTSIHPGLQSYSEPSSSNFSDNEDTIINYFRESAPLAFNAEQRQARKPPAKPPVKYSRDAVYPQADAQVMAPPMPNAFNVGQVDLFLAPQSEKIGNEKKQRFVNGQIVDDEDWTAVEKSPRLLNREEQPPKPRKKRPKRFPITILTFNGHSFKLQVSSNDKISSLKRQIGLVKDLPTTGLAPEGFRLNYQGQLLMDQLSVRDCEIEEGSVVHCRWILVGM